MSTIFTIEKKVGNIHIDDLGHVNNVVYLQWVQDIANQHWDFLKKGFDVSSCVWVVLRHEIDYLGQAVMGDSVVVKTWVGETEGVKSIRYVEFSKQNKILVKAKTYWCLLDATTLKPKRITEEIMRVLALK